MRGRKFFFCSTLTKKVMHKIHFFLDIDFLQNYTFV